jgi:hypothetical protein
MHCWTVNYQPPTGDPVSIGPFDTDTPEGRQSFLDANATALDAGATQITPLLDLMGGCGGD